MSKSQVLAVFDSAIQEYGRPMFVPAVGAALRSFIDEVNRVAPDNQFHHHCEDFELRLLAEFDAESGAFVPLDDGIRVIARGKDVRREGVQS